MAPVSPPASLPVSPLALDSTATDKVAQATEKDDDKHTELAFGERWKDAAKPARPSLVNMGDGPDGRRKSSVQFHTAPAEETIRRESLVQVPRISISRRQSSPPPPATYRRGVSFDTFDNRDATDYSFTMNYKHKDYVHTRRSRTFLCGADEKDYSEFALEWLIDELVEDGDEIVCLRVVDKETKTTSGMEAGKYREQAKRLLDSVIRKNSQEDKAISLIMELAVGRVQDVIQRTIQIYEPAGLIVGTRGRNLGGMQGLLPGSVSKYCLQHSPIPVIVVRPSTKRAKKKMKRALDTSSTRSLYGSMLHQAQSLGGSHALDRNYNNVSLGTLAEATDQETAAVAQAIGLPRTFRRPYGGRLSRVTRTDPDDSPSPTEGFLPAGIFRAIVPDKADKALQSPAMAALAEDVWDDDDDETAFPKRDQDEDERSQSPEERSHFLGVARTVEERRPSVRETNPWLDQILRKDVPPRRLSPAPMLGHNRSRSR